MMDRYIHAPVITDASGEAIQHLEIDRREIREPPVKPEQGREQYMAFDKDLVEGHILLTPLFWLYWRFANLPAVDFQVLDRLATGIGYNRSMNISVHHHLFHGFNRVVLDVAGLLNKIISIFITF